jgi:hypothetical protein
VCVCVYIHIYIYIYDICVCIYMYIYIYIYIHIHTHTHTHTHTDTHTHTHTHTGKLTDSVSRVKGLICAKVGVFVNQLRLLLGDKPLVDDTKSLKWYSYVLCVYV